MLSIPSDILGFFPTPDSFYEQVVMCNRGETRTINADPHFVINTGTGTSLSFVVIVSEYQSVRVSTKNPFNEDEWMHKVKILYYDVLMLLLRRKYIFSRPFFKYAYSAYSDTVELSITTSVGTATVNDRVDAFISSFKDFLLSVNDRNELAVAALHSVYLKHSDNNFVGLEHLECLVRSTDLNMLRTSGDVFKFLCLLRGTVTGELK